MHRRGETNKVPHHKLTDVNSPVSLCTGHLERLLCTSHTQQFVSRSYLHSDVHDSGIQDMKDVHSSLLDLNLNSSKTIVLRESSYIYWQVWILFTDWFLSNNYMEECGIYIYSHFIDEFLYRCWSVSAGGACIRHFAPISMSLFEGLLLLVSREKISSKFVFIRVQ